MHTDRRERGRAERRTTSASSGTTRSTRCSATRSRSPRATAHGGRYIPHFIAMPGYVYAYAYGQLLALSVYRTYEERGADFVPQYLELLAQRRLALARGARPHRRRRPRAIPDSGTAASPSSSSSWKRPRPPLSEPAGSPADATRDPSARARRPTARRQGRGRHRRWRRHRERDLGDVRGPRRARRGRRDRRRSRRRHRGRDPSRQR